MSTVDTSNSTNTSTANNTSAAQSRFDNDYETFLKLLTTQLQNQDPTQPADTNQLTQQIAALSSVEQQIATNKNLHELIAKFNTTQLNSAVGYIGKQVDVVGNQGSLSGGQALFVYNLPAGTASAEVTITNSVGQTVFKGPGTTLAGRNPVVWDGKNESGVAQPDGIYKVSVKAKTAAGEDLEVTTLTSGIVSSVDSKDGVTTLALGGGLNVPLTDVISVRTPGAV